MPAEGLIQFAQAPGPQSPGKALAGQPHTVTHRRESHLQKCLDGAFRPAQMTDVDAGKDLTQLQAVWTGCSTPALASHRAARAVGAQAMRA